MILHRFMKHVTEQNWFATGLDAIGNEIEKGY